MDDTPLRTNFPERLETPAPGRDPQAPPAWLAWTSGIALMALWGYLRLVVFSGIVFPLTFVLPLLICVWTRRRSMLWLMAASFTVMIWVKVFVVTPGQAFAPGEALATLYATLINILVGALVVHLIIVLRKRLEHSLKNLAQANEQILAQNTELAQQAEELASQAEEMTQQSEELASHNETLNRQTEEMAQQNEELMQQSEELAQQNEELQTQSEEIQALNIELGRREALMQGLLDAARLSGSEESAMQDVCAASLEMFGELNPVIVVYEMRGDELLIQATAGADGRA